MDPYIVMVPVDFSSTPVHNRYFQENMDAELHYYANKDKQKGETESRGRQNKNKDKDNDRTHQLRGETETRVRQVQASGQE